MSNLILKKVLYAIDIGVIEQSADGLLNILGTPPDWLKRLLNQTSPDVTEFAITDDSSFLGSFIIDAAEFWETKQTGKVLWSGPWEEATESGEENLLEAGAIYLEHRNLLIIRSLSHNGITNREELQKIRENILAFEELSISDRELEKYKDYLEQEVQKRTQQVVKTLEGVTHAIAAITEMRDPYTAGHQLRVAELACAIAREMGRPEEEIEGLHMAGALHDIGKICIPAEILSKPCKLSEAEIEIIRSHPQAGYDILKNIDFPRPIAKIVLQHHENIDGSGYPDRISGENILLKARILRVADVVEAMSSYRPYRPAHGTDKALEEIEGKRGILYDVNVVDACLRLFREKGYQLC
jgi:putative nucleotidyltransferase with HDIG domain